MSNFTKRKQTRAERVAAFFSKVETKSIHECWMWKGAIRSFSYGSFQWLDDKMWAAHRVSWVIANGTDIPEGMDICHRCDTPLCVNPIHLFPGTHVENMKDMHAKGRHRVTSKLTAVDVREILANPPSKWNTGKHVGAMAEMAEYAARYGVGTAAIGNILAGRTWKHIQRPAKESV